MNNNKILEPEIINLTYHEKAWGSETWIINTPDYCLKYLNFNKGSKFSMHFHAIKKETWTIESGKFILRWINTENAETKIMVLEKDMIINIPQLLPHQIECIEEGRIIEVSTQHFEKDSYRVGKGDSQN
jgi:mannose-6-phosphate isomerase-like protein (cupin superfamily)